MAQCWKSRAGRQARQHRRCRQCAARSCSRCPARVHSANIWIYQPGRAIATKDVSFARNANPFVVLVTLDDQSKFTINVLGPDNRPITGLRVTPDMLRAGTVPGKSVWATIPASWHERLTATTNDTGVATLTYLPGIMKPVSVRVAGQGVAPHTLRLGSPEGSNAVLKLWPSRASGRNRPYGFWRLPLSGVPVQFPGAGGEYPAQRLQHRRPDSVNSRITPDEMLRFDPEPLKTGPQERVQQN